ERALRRFAHFRLHALTFDGETEERAAQERAALALDLRLAAVDAFEVALEALQRRHALGEGGLDDGTAVLLPPSLERRLGEIGLGLEIVVEAALLHAGEIADGIHGHGVVA